MAFLAPLCEVSFIALANLSHVSDSRLLGHARPPEAQSEGLISCDARENGCSRREVVTQTMGAYFDWVEAQSSGHVS